MEETPAGEGEGLELGLEPDVPVGVVFEDEGGGEVEFDDPVVCSVIFSFRLHDQDYARLPSLALERENKEVPLTSAVHSYAPSNCPYYPY